MHAGEAAAVCVERDPRAAGSARRPGDAGGGVALGNEGAGLAARHKAQILKAVDRQMGDGVVGHQMVDVLVRDAGFGKGVGAGNAERARGGAFSSRSRKRGGPGQLREPRRFLDSCFRRNDGWV